MEQLMYKNRPIVRSGNKLYYGSMSEKYVVYMEIESTAMVENMEVADRINVQLLSTDPSLSKRKRVIKTTKRNGLFSAVDIAEVWLKRYCKKDS